MEDLDRPILILFMGERTEHAELSIECFYPASVHIITSEKFGGMYEDVLNEWATKYDFRRGTVQAINNLFSQEAIESLLFSAFFALNEDVEATGDISFKREKLIGITGGTMHMAAAGTYLGQLLNATPFYVMRPPDGQAPVAKRDIICFPTLRGTNFIGGTSVEHISYIMNNKQGSLKEFYEETGLPEGYVRTAYNLGMFGVKPDEDRWYLTDIGLHSYGFMTSSKLWGEFGNLLQTYYDMNSNKRDDFDPSVM